jgi:hypothetical protein
VSRDAINAVSSVTIAVPFTTYRERRRIYPSHVVVHAPDGGLDVDSVALCSADCGKPGHASQRTQAERRLRFARWLFEQGKLTDS